MGPGTESSLKLSPKEEKAPGPPPPEKGTPEDKQTALPVLNTETAAMKDEKIMDTSDVQRPKSCREKFLHAWNEKLKLQSGLPLSAQVPEGQPDIHVPDHEKRTGDGTQPSQLLTGPSSEPNENAVYFFIMEAPCPPCPLPRSYQEAESLPHHLPLAPCGNTTDWETGDNEEFLQICTSDIVLRPPGEKRPRLLPLRGRCMWKCRRKKHKP